MGETKHQEHVRLQKRTDALKEEHEELGVDRHPYNQADHDAHSAALKQHKADLEQHRARPDDGT